MSKMRQNRRQDKDRQMALDTCNCSTSCADGATVSLEAVPQGLEKNFDYKKVLKAFKKGTLVSRESNDAELTGRELENVLLRTSPIVELLANRGRKYVHNVEAWQICGLGLGWVTHPGPSLRID
jgi:hypothetical protein